MNIRNPEKKSTRDGYGDALLELGKQNKNVVVLCADLTESTKTHKFKEKYPSRFVETGIAEQNMMNIAAGLALSGKIPFASSFGLFDLRAWEQIRTTICYANINVKIGGSHAGISIGEDGATQMATEDIAAFRCLPNMTVIVPCDYNETKKAVFASVKIKGPAYIRFGRPKQAIITSEKDKFEIGKANVLRKGKDVTIIACGLMVYEALNAAEKLKSKRIDAEVINMHTIKPIDTETVIKSSKKTKAIVTAEEHQIHGGLGGAVAEVISKSYPVPIEMIAIEDKFGESGKAEELLKKYKLTSSEIVKKVEKVLKRK